MSQILRRSEPRAGTGCTRGPRGVSSADAPLTRAAQPREIVRDLLGITRALYRAEFALPPPRSNRLRLDHLEEIGKKFGRALDLSRGDPDTMGHRAAWSWAEQATQALGEFVGDEMQLGPVLQATAKRLRRR
jgi:hypothetical protein